MTYAPVNAKSAFLDTSEVYPKEPSDLLIKLTSVNTNISNAVNVREISQYENGLPLLTGQQFSTPGDNQIKKLSYRTLYYFGAIASGATLNMAHGITGLTQFTHMYGTCVTDVVDYRPIPFSSTAALNQQISLRVVGANIEIINGAGGPNITYGMIILEYLLN